LTISPSAVFIAFLARFFAAFVGCGASAGEAQTQLVVFGIESHESAVGDETDIRSCALPVFSIVVSLPRFNLANGTWVVLARSSCRIVPTAFSSKRQMGQQQVVHLQSITGIF
jgi:hypothetical protein